MYFVKFTTAGSAGARLTHHHERQYMYVKQSLLLWREINHNMFKVCTQLLLLAAAHWPLTQLWCKAEDDMLCECNPYRLINTGAKGGPHIVSCTKITHNPQGKG